MNETPPILRSKDRNAVEHIAKLFAAEKLDAVEKSIKHTFTHKAHLLAALTHPSHSQDALTINYKR